MNVIAAVSLSMLDGYRAGMDRPQPPSKKGGFVSRDRPKRLLIYGSSLSPLAPLKNKGD
jgi:hypothetical protein